MMEIECYDIRSDAGRTVLYQRYQDSCSPDSVVLLRVPTSNQMILGGSSWDDKILAQMQARALFAEKILLGQWGGNRSEASEKNVHFGSNNLDDDFLLLSAPPSQQPEESNQGAVDAIVDQFNKIQRRRTQ